MGLFGTSSDNRSGSGMILGLGLGQDACQIDGSLPPEVRTLHRFNRVASYLRPRPRLSFQILGS